MKVCPNNMILYKTIGDICRWNLKVHQKRNYKLHHFKDEQNCLLKKRSGGTNERSDNVQPSSVTGASVKEPVAVVYFLLMKW